MYQRKLAEVEQKLTDLEASIAMTIKSADNNEIVPHVMLTELKNKLTETIMQLEDRGVIVANQEKQINALNVQVSTLKEVVAITRDLLQIRNTEVKHLQVYFMFESYITKKMSNWNLFYLIDRGR